MSTIFLEVAWCIEGSKYIWLCVYYPLLVHEFIHTPIKRYGKKITKLHGYSYFNFSGRLSDINVYVFSNHNQDLIFFVKTFANWQYNGFLWCSSLIVTVYSPESWYCGHIRFSLSFCSEILSLKSIHAFLTGNHHGVTCQHTMTVKWQRILCCFLSRQVHALTTPYTLTLPWCRMAWLYCDQLSYKFLCFSRFWPSL